ncbi:DMT family transporter [Microbacterium sp. K41]|uniref:DMT family transporter n=1 Tax=Microbacterium sp. K41 TaxID=2305437 RepID=UPI00109CA93F|nr:DMT family transporter [Microbacterium sp. K41]
MLSQFRTERAVDLMLIGVAAVWGASFVAAKDLSSEVGAPSAVALRFLAAAAVTACICAIWGVRLPRGRGLVISGVLGVSQAAVIGLETFGVHLTSATNAGLLISLALVMTPALEGLASRSWLPRSYFVAAMTAVVGVALLVSAGGLRAPSVGDCLIIIAAAVRAIHVTASAQLTRGRTDSSLGVVLIQMLVCASLFSILAGAELPHAALRLSVAGWLNVLFLSLGCSVFAFVVQLWAVRRTSASRASILMGTEPVWALTFGVLLAGDQIGILGVLGGVLIVAASYAGQAIERSHRRSAERSSTIPPAMGASAPDERASATAASLPEAASPTSVTRSRLSPR